MYKKPKLGPPRRVLLKKSVKPKSIQTVKSSKLITDQEKYPLLKKELKTKPKKIISQDMLEPTKDFLQIEQKKEQENLTPQDFFEPNEDWLKLVEADQNKFLISQTDPTNPNVTSRIK